jgi:hypothetical protein
MEQQLAELQKMAKSHEGTEREADEQELARIQQRMERLTKVLEARKARAAAKE